MAKLVFVSYAPQDIAHRDALDKHLGALRRAGAIDVWHDGDVPAGADRDAESRKRLDEAALVLLLLSADYLDSDVCRAEMDHAIERQRAELADVVPVLVRPCELAGELPSMGKALPSDGRPVTVWPDKDSAWADVADGVARLLGVDEPHVSARAERPPEPSASDAGARPAAGASEERPPSAKRYGAIGSAVAIGIALAATAYAIVRGASSDKPSPTSGATTGGATSSATAPSPPGSAVTAPELSAKAAVSSARLPPSSSPRPALDCPSGMAAIIAEGPVWVGGKVNGRKVTLAPYCIDKTEVTVAAFAKCVAAGACASANPTEECNAGKPDRQDHPMNCVSWKEASAYCQRAGGRLPTEEEWEFAGRGPDGRKYPWGSEEPSDQACWNGPGNDMGWRNRRSTCPVGKYEAGNSPFGLSDMAGNVAEWTAGLFHPNDGPDRHNRAAVHGGWWSQDNPAFLECVESFYEALEAHNHDIGFRCVKGLP